MSMISLVNGGRIVKGGGTGSAGMLETYNKTSQGYESTGLAPAPGLLEGTRPKASPISVDVTAPIPSTALNTNVGPAEVLRKRTELESTRALESKPTQDFNTLEQQVNSFNSSPFKDPQGYLQNVLFGERKLSQAEGMQNEVLAGTYNATTDFYGNRQQDIADAQTQFGVSNLQQNLSTTREKIAKRQVKLREDLKAFETDAALRGGPRAFTEDSKQAVQRNAEFELANLSIIEAAQTGNLQEARQLANDLTDRQYEEFQGQIAQYGAFLNALQPTLKKEDEQRAQQMQVALKNYEMELQTQRDDTKAKRELLAIAAAQGAPENIQNGILNAGSVEQAIQAAGEYGGDILDREAKSVNIQAARMNMKMQQAEMDAMAARQAAVLSGALMPEDAETVDAIDKEFRSEPIVKEYNTAVAKRGAVLEIMNNGVSGVQDLLLVYEFMKSVDPTSVVRESEFDNAAKTGNIFAGQWTKFNQGYFGAGGFLPSEVKSSFTNALNASYSSKQNLYNNLKTQFGEKINRRLGVQNGSDFLTQYDAAAPIEATLPANTGSYDPLGIFGQTQPAAPTSSLDSFTQGLIGPQRY